MCDRLMHGRDVQVSTITSARSPKSLNLGRKLNERVIAVLPRITRDCTEKSLGRQLRRVEAALVNVRVNVVGESRVLESLLLARNSRNSAYREFRRRSSAVKELKVEHFENLLDLNFTWEQLRELQRTSFAFQNRKLTSNLDAMINSARSRAFKSAGEAAEYETESSKGLRAWKLRKLKAAAEFLTLSASKNDRLSYRTTSRGDINGSRQYLQLHYAGDRAGGIHFQFISLLNVSRPATDKDSLTTASIYDSSKSYIRIEKFLKNQIEEFDNLAENILTRVRYPPLTIEQINDNRKHLQVIEQFKQHKVPRIDLIPNLISLNI